MCSRRPDITHSLPEGAAGDQELLGFRTLRRELELGMEREADEAGTCGDGDNERKREMRQRGWGASLGSTCPSYLLLYN